MKLLLLFLISSAVARQNNGAVTIIKVFFFLRERLIDCCILISGARPDAITHLQDCGPETKADIEWDQVTILPTTPRLGSLIMMNASGRSHESVVNGTGVSTSF